MYLFYISLMKDGATKPHPKIEPPTLHIHNPPFFGKYLKMGNTSQLQLEPSNIYIYVYMHYTCVSVCVYGKISMSKTSVQRTLVTATHHPPSHGGGGAESMATIFKAVCLA